MTGEAMTDAQLEAKLSETIQLDRRTTHEVLVLINEAQDRQLYAKRGFSTMKCWLVKRFLYSDSAAYQRLHAANLLRAVPEIAEKIVSGEVNLSTLTTAHKIMREQEKLSGQALSAQAKAQVLIEIENKSAWDVEASLLELFPRVTLESRKESKKNVDADTVRVSANFNRATLNQIEELRKQNHINGGFKEVVEFLVKKAANSAAQKSFTRSPGPRHVAAVHESKLRETRVRDSRVCQYQDQVTGQACGADNWLEEDHILPVALGGSDHPENKRWLCRAHNQLEAKQKLGPLANYRGQSTRRLQLKAANRLTKFRTELFNELALV